MRRLLTGFWLDGITSQTFNPFPMTRWLLTGFWLDGITSRTFNPFPMTRWLLTEFWLDGITSQTFIRFLMTRSSTLRRNFWNQVWFCLDRFWINRLEYSARIKKWFSPIRLCTFFEDGDNSWCNVVCCHHITVYGIMWECLDGWVDFCALWFTAMMGFLPNLAWQKDLFKVCVFLNDFFKVNF